MKKSSLEIYNFLKEKNLLKSSPPLWWPNSGKFEVVVGAILTQNTTWKNVEKSLENLREFLDIDSFLTLNDKSLKEKIIPSGFYNQKAPRLLTLTQDIKNTFHDFKTFQKEVSREWLLSKKGIGEESADAILCYACLRDEMVIDSYTKRLLKSFDIEFRKYSEYKFFLEDELRDVFVKSELNEIFAKYHGNIVEYNKSLKSFK